MTARVFSRGVYGRGRFSVDEERIRAWHEMLAELDWESVKACKRDLARRPNPPVPDDVTKAVREHEAGRTGTGPPEPNVPVPVWDRDLELGMFLIISGKYPEALAARNGLSSRYGTIEDAIDAFIRMVDAAPDGIGPQNFHNVAGLAGWRAVHLQLHARAASHWDHVRGRAHAV